eukprot:TRINITY_DN1783_c0_g4_i2.p1 TRINITY_DN1783_c0_g4~~TRINITY_DN1783_c0_g4_i2.p1  ORF type:complete len:502 (-),score=124.96 TRINITY_DN1783_c0_g4_i2:29-1534(-)
MDSKRLLVEIALLSLDPSLFQEASKDLLSSPNEQTQHLHKLIQELLNGNYEYILASPISHQLRLFQEDSISALGERIEALSTTGSSDAKSLNALTILALGVGSLLVFLQANWTGPNISDKLLKTSQIIARDEIQNFLAVDGEELYQAVEVPFFLLLARQLLLHPFITQNNLIAEWWIARALFIHQQCLTHQTATLKGIIHDSYDKTLKKLETSTVPLPPSFLDHEIMSRVLIEIGLVHHSSRSVKKAKECFVRAQKFAGLTCYLTGELGMRTKFQTFQTAQLVLHATSRTPSAIGAGTTDKNETPQEVDVEDSILLAVPKLLKESSAVSSNNRAIDQAILLSLCLDVKNQNADDGLTQEEMRAYVERVKEHPNDWLVHSLCLLIKARLELTRPKTVDRAALQLEALVDQHNTNDLPIVQIQINGDPSSSSSSSPSSPSFSSSSSSLSGDGCSTFSLFTSSLEGFWESCSPELWSSSKVLGILSSPSSFSILGNVKFQQEPT